ncbi:fibrinogen-like protein 1 [Drosophila innubila]|uniref:fibrinogen-like protein 1 n=1 Tax=Drosophila innubila TaxID=198719 RepID=UPI00148BF0F7|nr:fibrinogen-like protein 1 [Drosophila innubila]
MSNKLEACEIKNKQMTVLQSQLAVLKLKENICEKTIREKEEKCKSQEQLDADVNSLKNLMLHLTAQSRKDDQKLKELLKQMEDYRGIIENKNDLIRSLQTKLQINEAFNSNFTSIPAAMLLNDIKPEKQVKIFETSCLSIGEFSEIREIQVPGLDPFPVPCNGTIAGPGWTIIQQRVDNSENFNRNWTEYRNGFGDLERNFFIGLEKIYRMTSSQPHELYIYLKNFDNEIRYAHYNNFSIGSESDAYELKGLGEFSGDAGDALKLSKNMKFTTFDRDNDKYYANCAKERNGGWWYNQCALANLNGLYFERELDKWEGIFWHNWKKFRTLMSVQMLIRPSKETTVKK